MRHFLLAFQFLTIIPVPVKLRCEADDMGRATAWFPLAGLSIGGILLLADIAIAPLFPRQLADAMLIALLALLTGGLHLDGLADVFDGLAARGNKERFLSIMKDSRVGAIGVVGLVLALLLKYSALLALPVYMKRPSLLFFPAAARFCQVVLLSGSRSARSDGLGSAVLLGMRPQHLLAATAIILPVTWLTLKLAGVFALLSATAWAALVKLWFQKRLGGITGDIVGFMSEIAEILILLTITAAIAIMTWI